MEKLREAEENLQQLEQKMTTKGHTDEDSSSNQSPSAVTDTNQEVQQLKLQLEVRTEFKVKKIQITCCSYLHG